MVGEVRDPKVAWIRWAAAATVGLIAVLAAVFGAGANAILLLAWVLAAVISATILLFRRGG